MFDLAGVEKREIAAGVFVPAEFLLAIGVEDVGGGGEQRLHRIADAADPTEEEAQVVLLGEARELRDAVEAGVVDVADAGTFEPPEEVGGLALGEADREQPHAGVTALAGADSR